MKVDLTQFSGFMPYMFHRKPIILAMKRNGMNQQEVNLAILAPNLLAYARELEARNKELVEALKRWKHTEQQGIPAIEYVEACCFRDSLLAKNGGE